MFKNLRYLYTHGQLTADEVKKAYEMQYISEKQMEIILNSKVVTKK